MSRKLDWSRASRPRATSDDLFSDRRRMILTLGADTLLDRARALYRRARAEHQPNPFCHRCVASLKARRFTSLCSRCLFRIGHVTLAPRRRRPTR